MTWPSSTASSLVYFFTCGCSLACKCTTLISASIATWPSSPVCMFLFPYLFSFYKDSSHIGPTLLPYDLILTHYVDSGPVSKQGLILCCQEGHEWGWEQAPFNPEQVSTSSAWS